MSLNQDNVIYDNVFTEDEIKNIYDLVNGDNVKTQIVPIYCQQAYHFQIPENIINKVTQIAKDITKENLKLTEISFASYSKKYGELPLLSPHFDNTFEEKRLTLDVQLKSNISWPIVIKGRSFTLKDNQALTFSGTHQIHWREFRKFKEEDYIDMLFCHFSYVDNNEKTTLAEYRQIMSDSIYFVNNYYQEIIKERVTNE